MKRWLYLIVLLLGVAGSYLWLKTPSLAKYGPQVFLACILLYGLVRKLSTRFRKETTSSQKSPQVASFLPHFESWENVLLVVATVMLVGSTGGVGSLFFSANFVILLVIVFRSGDMAALTTSMAIAFVYAGLSTTITQNQVVLLANIPIVAVLLTLAKNQYLVAVQTTSKVLQDDDWNAQRSDSTGWFLEKFLKPTVTHIKELMGNPAKNHQTILHELSRIESRTDQLLDVYETHSDSEAAT